MTALYFSRSLVECLAATPFQRDVRSAFDKLAAALTPGMRQLLDRLPLVMQAKAEPGGQSTMDDPATPATASKQSRRGARRVAQLLDATLHHRRVTMRYHSFSSNREKDYLLEPYRLVFAQGGLYVVAFVPEYKQLRTFAVERILSLSVTEERFEPVELARGRVRALARRQPGHARTHRDRVRAAHRAVREGARRGMRRSRPPKQRTAR